MIGGLLLVMTISHGIISAGLPALDTAILADWGISRGALKLRETIFLLSSGVSGLLIGFLTIRIKPSTIVMAGLCLLSATLWFYSIAQSIQQIYVLYMFLGMCFASAHVVVVVLMVRDRFELKRTLAIAIALSGTSIGSAIFPNIAVIALEHWDWQSVLRGASILPLLILPITFILVRDGKPSSATENKAVEGTQSNNAASAQRKHSSFALILLLIATCGTFFASTAFLLNLFLYLQDIGLTQRTAALGLSVVFLTGLVGKILVGIAAERWGTNQVWNVQQIILFFGAVLLCLANPAIAFVGLVFLGIGWAGCYVLTQVVIADHFAGPKLGQLIGAFIVFEAISSGTGVWAAGAIFDLYGSYLPGFYMCSGIIFIAAVAGFLFKRTVESEKKSLSLEGAAL